MSNTIQFDVSFRNPGQSQQVKNPERIKILVLGGFSGRRSASSTQQHRVLNIDCDNLEQRMRQLSPSLDLSVGENVDFKLHIEFSELEDFHPDKLYDRVELFDELRNLRTNLSNPQTFAETARSFTGETALPSSRSEPSPETGSSSFADLLNKPGIQDRSAVQTHPVVAALIRKFVTSNMVDEPGEQDRLLQSVDTTLSIQMRQILHHEDFQALESAWKGLDFLVRELELGAELSLHILDLSKQQLAAELSSPDLKVDSALYKTLVTEAGVPGTEPWNLVVGLYNFAMSDLSHLSSIANLARRAGTTFMTGLSVQRLPSEPDPGWETMQHSQGASNLCLCTPGFLLRLPYGTNTGEIDRFEFEEMPQPPIYGHYLWGNAALVCAALIAKSLGCDELCPGSITQLDGLPVHSYRLQGEYEMTPCGGIWLSDSDARRLIELGVIPVLSVKNSDAVRVMGFQTLAGGPVFV